MLSLLCFLILSCVFAKADGATNETAFSEHASNEKSLDSGEGKRDPFWPIGYFPASMPGRASQPVPNEGRETVGQASGLSGMLRIGGISRKGNTFYATINGFTVQTGEVVSVVANGKMRRFVVEEIDFNKVRFRPLRK